MSRSLTELQLKKLLGSGVRKTQGFIEQSTDYHGGEVLTEYLLTTDIAREFLAEHYEVEVEFLNKRFINALTRKPGAKRSILGKKRTDVAVIDGPIPLAIIEVKIGVGKTIRVIKDDLIKITETINLLNHRAAGRVIGAAVFQLHLKATKSRHTIDQFAQAISARENSLGSSLQSHAASYPAFKFELFPLHKGPIDGIREQEVIEHDTHTEAGAPPHATRYYAVLIRSTSQVPPAATSFQALKQRSQG